METVEKIYTLEVRDQFGLPPETLMRYAVDAANEMALELGWKISEVKASGAQSRKESEFLIHSFDVFGVSSRGATVDGQTTEQCSVPGFSKSASDANP